MLPHPLRRTAAAATVVTLALLLAAPAAHASWRSATCRFGHGDGFSSSEVRQTIYCATHHWSVDGGVPKALSVASCESGFNESAYYNGNAGVFQQNVRYWPARHVAYNGAVGVLLDSGPSAYNARSNVLVSIRYAHFNGWGAWSCA